MATRADQGSIPQTLQDPDSTCYGSKALHTDQARCMHHCIMIDLLMYHVYIYICMCMVLFHFGVHTVLFIAGAQF